MQRVVQPCSPHGLVRLVTTPKLPFLDGGLQRLRHLAGDSFLGGFLGGIVFNDGIQAIPLPSAAGRPIRALPLVPVGGVRRS